MIKKFILKNANLLSDSSPKEQKEIWQNPSLFELLYGKMLTIAQYVLQRNTKYPTKPILNNPPLSVKTLNNQIHPH